jgi:hypothetical protein
VKIAQETLEILSAVECSGTHARIVEQLDRKTYMAVNKILESVGGKWNRKAQAHLFDGDAQAALDDVLATGEVESKRDVGWFATPPLVAEKLIGKFVNAGDHVLEPSAGDGALVVPLLHRGAHVTAFERDDRRRAALNDAAKLALAAGAPGTFGERRAADGSTIRDFMECFDGAYDAVIMNPPFKRVGLGDHLDHVRRAATMLTCPPHGGRAVLRAILPASIVWRRDLRHEQFRYWLNNLDGTIESLPEGSFAASGTMVSTVIITVSL